MPESNCRKFQSTVSNYLIRHRSVLDTTSKFQEASARVNRAIAKAVTSCGCLKVKAGKQPIPKEASLSEATQYMQTHLEGNLCDSCREAIETEIGTALFYLTAICHLLGLDMDEIMHQENDRITTLGLYSLT